MFLKVDFGSRAGDPQIQPSSKLSLSFAQNC